MGMDREVRKGIQKAGGEIYKRTSVSSIKFRQKMRMEVDALDYTIGDVLFMECEDRRWKLVIYLSKSLNETE